MSNSVLLVSHEGPVATVTLNRPQAMNALSRELRAAIARTFRDLEANGTTRVVILTGAGRAFCAGLDLKELGQDTSGLGAQSQITDNDPVSSIARFSGPVIGAINGVAITGGFELALACDVLVASSEARFADTHARVGIMPGWGLSQKLSRLIGIYRAKELSLTGNFLSAADANAWGLVNRVVNPGELMPTARQLALDMASVVPECLVAYKRLIDEGFARDFGSAMAHEQSVSAAANVGVKAADVEGRREGIRQRGQAQTQS